MARRAAVNERRELTETYCGVEFTSGPVLYQPGEAVNAVITLMYWPHSIYDAIVPGATFTVREAHHIVGYGSVERWWTEG
jgi:hypothetical protein